jgi:uncharacterized protein
MAQLPRILKNMNLFADGIGTAGFIEEMTTPTLALQMEEHRAGGMDLPAEVDMGMDKLEASFQLSDPNETVIKCLGRPGVLYIARSAHQRDGEDAQPAIVNMTGTLKSYDPGSFTVGQKANHTFTITLLYYKLAINGVDLVEIDVMNMIRKIGGVDQIASIRTAIGV